MENKQWKEVGPLDKKVAFKYTKDLSPLDSLHREVRRLLPNIKEVSEIAVTPKTNEYLRARLEKHARRKFNFLTDKKIESSVAFAMMDLSPCDYQDGEDFVLYVRTGNRKKK